MPKKISCQYCLATSGLSVLFSYKTKKLYRCQGCGLIFTYPHASKEVMKHIYNENYYQNTAFQNYDETTFYGYSDYIKERFYKQQNYVKIIEGLREFIPINDKTSLLDYGCGLGYFIDAAHDFGCQVSGVEVNPYAVDYIARKFRYQIFNGDNLDVVPGTYDVISMLDVIEHLHEPFKIIKTAHAKLKSKGILVMTTIDSGSLVCKLLGRNMEDYRRVQEHFFFFDRHLIRKILEKNGFEVKSIKSIGHTFELGHLCERFSAYNRFIFTLIHKALKWTRFDRYSIYFNPHTKMIVTAQKRVL